MVGVKNITREKFSESDLEREDRDLQDIVKHLSKNRKNLPDTALKIQWKNVAKRSKELARRKKLIKGL